MSTLRKILKVDSLIQRSVLMMHNKPRVFPRGTVSLQLDRNGHGYRVKFLIVDKCEVPLLSLVTSEQLSLVKIMDSDATTGTDTPREVRQVNVTPNNKPMEKEKILHEYRDVFEGLVVYLESIILRLIRVILQWCMHQEDFQSPSVRLSKKSWMKWKQMIS